MPPETQGEVIIDGHRIESTWYANTVRVARYGADFNVVQDAIDYCDAITGDWVIEIYSNTYLEGDLTSTGGANITLKGMGIRRAVIAPAGAPAVAVIVATHTLTIERLVVTAPDNTRPALRVTGGTCDVIDSILSGAAGGDCIQQVGGELNLVLTQTVDGDIDLRDAACTLNIGHCSLFVTGGAFDTADGAGANVVMTVTAEYTEFHGAVFTLAATGACTHFFDKCTGMANIADASLVGAGTLRQCHVAGTGLDKTGTSPWDIFTSFVTSVSNNNGVGAITISGGHVAAILRAVGSVVWWLDNNTLKVIPSGTVTDTVIQWAVAEAGAGDTIVLHPGTYRESVVLAAGINLVGIDREGCLVDVTDGNTGITMAEGCRVAGFRMVVTASGGNSRGIECNNAGAAATPLYIDVDIHLVRSGGNAYGISEVTGNAVRIIHIRGRITSDTTTNEHAIICDQANKTFHIEESWLQGGDYGINCDAASTFYIDHTFVDVNVVPPGGGTTIYCAAATMYFRNCIIEKNITTALLGIVRMKKCSYRQINRTGTGSIVDESPQLQDVLWHIQKWAWQAALASLQVNARGTPIDAGFGQILLEVTDNLPGAEGVESIAEAAGALGNYLTPARTPRFLTQISVDSFDAHVEMFYGLRETLGDSLPVATEEHAGFVWNGNNFQASSDDGAATETTNLTEPSTNVQHQLEVIVFGGVSVEFYIDGVLVATHTTRVPSAALDWQHLLETAGGGDGDLIQVTVRNGGVQECPA